MNSFIEKFFKDQKPLLYSLFLILVLIIFFITFPMMKSVFIDYKEIKIMREQIVNAKNWKNISAQYKTEIDKLNSFINVYNNSFIKSSSSNDIIKYIQIVCKENNVEITFMDSAFKKNKSENKPIQIIMEGKYHNIGKVFHSIESSPYLIFVQSFKLNKQKQSRDKLKIEIILEIKQVSG